MNSDNMKPTTIIGAGYAGLLAAIRFPYATVIEAAPEPKNKHNALLRFRSDVVSKLTDIPFKKVKVDKGIVQVGTEAHPTPTIITKCDMQLANQYSEKVTGAIGGRSIWNLESCERYIAPPFFFEMLVGKVHDRIRYNTPLTELDQGANYINTIPLPMMLKIANIQLYGVDVSFQKKEIIADQYEIGGDCDIYQTLYFTNPYYSVYRASITGNVLIVERTGEGNPLPVDCILRAFGISFKRSVKHISSLPQMYGKIMPLEKKLRDDLLFALTTNFNVFSVGRFATWRNILLDEVVDDLNTVERLIKSSDYSRNLLLTK